MVLADGRVRRHCLLLGTSAFDPVMPQSQMTEMRLLRPKVAQTMLLDGALGGNATNLTHANVTPAALARW